MPNSKVKILSTIAIVLGVIGLVGTLIGAVSFVMGPRAAAAPVMGLNAEQVEISKAMTKASLDLANTWNVYNGLELIFSLLIAVALIAGGVMGLKYRKQGWSILTKTFVVGIPVKVVHAVVSTSISLRTMEIMHEFMPKLMRAASAGKPMPAGVEGVTTGIMEASAVLGIVWIVGWNLLVIGYYVVGSIYLRKPDVRASFKA